MSLFKVLHSFASDHASGNRLLPREEDYSSYDINPLPDDHRKGLIAVSVMAILSTIATFSLIAFITYRLVFWRGNYQRYIGYNQYVILIYNLVIADIQQSLAFLICLKWYAEDKIEANTAACFLQGLWLQIGDPASGIFVLAIAFHTFYLVALGRKLSHKSFVIIVCGLWLFVAVLVIIPIGIHGRFVFIPAGAWCWIGEGYEPVRLGTHYVWIFFAEFGTITLYAILWFQLRRRIKQSAILGSSHIESLKRLRRVVGYMVIYPLAYIVLSLPLAAGRMATEQGNTPSIVYFCVAGAMITSSGLTDVLLYTLTRKNLIIESEPSMDRSYNKFAGKNHPLSSSTNPKHMRTDISALHTFKGMEDEEQSRDGSTDDIVKNTGDVELAPIGKVYQQTTIEITSEPAYPSSGDASGSGRTSQDSLPPTGKMSPPARRWGR